MATTKKPPKPTAPPAVLSAPIDALGTAGDGELLANMLTQLQEKRKQVVLLRVANLHNEDDPLPGWPLGPNGEITSYRKRTEELLAAEAALLASQPEATIEAARKVLKLRQRQAAQTLDQINEEE